MNPEFRRFWGETRERESGGKHYGRQHRIWDLGRARPHFRLAEYGRRGGEIPRLDEIHVTRLNSAADLPDWAGGGLARYEIPEKEIEQSRLTVGFHQAAPYYPAVGIWTIGSWSVGLTRSVFHFNLLRP